VTVIPFVRLLFFSFLSSHQNHLSLSLEKMAACIFTVAQDGTADFQTVQEAIDAVPLGNIRRTVIRVSPGIYRQPVYVPKTKNFITLAALSPEDTVLTWNNTATGIDHHQVRTFSSLRLFPQIPFCRYVSKLFIFKMLSSFGLMGVCQN